MVAPYQGVIGDRLGKISIRVLGERDDIPLLTIGRDPHQVRHFEFYRLVEGERDLTIVLSTSGFTDNVNVDSHTGVISAAHKTTRRIGDADRRRVPRTDIKDGEYEEASRNVILGWVYPYLGYRREHHSTAEKNCPC
jgi:hypothetical protein